MLETRKVYNNPNTKISLRKTLFVNLRPLYITDMGYLEEYSGSECVILFTVQW